MLMNYNSWLPLFIRHTQQTERKFKLTFYFWIESCLSSEKRNTCCFHLYASAGLWWCDLYVYVFMCLHVLDFVYHGAVRFITNPKLLPTAVRCLLGSHGLLCHFIESTTGMLLFMRLFLVCFHFTDLQSDVWEVSVFSPMTHSFCLPQKFGLNLEKCVQMCSSFLLESKSCKTSWADLLQAANVFPAHCYSCSRH